MTSAIDKYAPQNFQQLMEFAEVLSKTGVVPDQYKGKPGEIVAVVQMGSELGMTPMMSLTSISVINGKPSLWGDGLLGVVSGHQSFEDILEEIDNPMTPNAVATCTIKRRGRSAVVRSFSVKDATVANLWGRRGPWCSYPMRMLQMRARGLAIRDCFPDVLRGMGSTEEHEDMNADVQSAPEVSERAKELLGEPQVAYPSVTVKETEHELLAPYVTAGKPHKEVAHEARLAHDRKRAAEQWELEQAIKKREAACAAAADDKQKLKTDTVIDERDIHYPGEKKSERAMRIAMADLEREKAQKGAIDAELPEAGEKKKGRGRPTLDESLQKMFKFFSGYGVEAGDVFRYLGVDDIDGVRSKELKKLRAVAAKIEGGVNPDDFFAGQPSGDVPPPPAGNIADAQQ